MVAFVLIVVSYILILNLLTNLINVLTQSVDRAMPGPLYAMDDDIAEIILGQLLRCDSCFNDEVSFFTSSKSVGGLRLAKEVLNLTEAERCAKLYTRTIPPFNYDMQYACHTPDFAC